MAPREELEMLIVIAWRDVIALEEEKATAGEGEWGEEEMGLALTNQSHHQIDGGQARRPKLGDERYSS